MKLTKPLILILIGILLIAIPVSYGIASYLIHSTGNIHTPNANLQLSTTTLDWGTLAQNQVTTRTVSVTNIGDAPTSPLNMTNTCTIGTLTWNRENTAIPAGNTINLVFTLTVSPTAPEGAFSFDITVTG